MLKAQRNRNNNTLNKTKDNKYSNISTESLKAAKKRQSTIEQDCIIELEDFIIGNKEMAFVLKSTLHKIDLSTLERKHVLKIAMSLCQMNEN